MANDILNEKLWAVVRAVLGLPPLLLVFLWCWYYWRNRRIISAAAKRPTVTRALPIIGHAYYYFYNETKITRTMMYSVTKAIAEEMGTTIMWIGPVTIFSISKGEDILTVLSSSKTMEKSHLYDKMKFGMGNGLLTAPDTVHRVTRLHVHPLFMPQNIQQLTPVFNESSRHLVRDLSRHVGRGHVNIAPFITETTLKNACHLMFGPDIIIDTKSEAFKMILNAVQRNATLTSKRMIHVYLWPDSIFEFIYKKDIKEIRSHLKIFADYTRKTQGEREQIQNVKEYYKTNYFQGTKDSARSVTLPDTYHTLRQSHPGFTEDDLHNEMMTLFFTGMETSSALICNLLLQLAANPDIQDRVYEEICSVLGAEDKPVMIEDLISLSYLDQVYREALRVASVVPFIFRRADDDIEISDCTIPAGSIISLSLLGMNRDPKVFPDPERFDPERFSPENAVKLNKSSYLPFSAGSRNCIGKMYSGILTKIIVIHILRHYSLSTTVDPASLNYYFALTMTSVEGYPVQLRDRTQDKCRNTRSC